MAPSEQPKTKVRSAGLKVRSAGLEDQASSKDFLGFTPYVSAIFNFLENDHTKPPFTLSIEGDWGSGKSSFMLQLQNKLKSNEAIVINFNAWRHDKMESMWAAFALTFIKQLTQSRSVFLRPFLNLLILIRRFDWKKGLIELLVKAVLIGLYLALVFAFYNRGGLSKVADFLLSNKGKLEDLSVEIMSSLGFAGLVIGGIFFLRKLADILGNPLAIDLSKYINKPDYESNTSFIESFHADFDKAVRVLAFRKKKVYVFIDDLDRAEIPKAAELMQGLNMMISNSPKIIFVIGMDREKVAAGVAAKYEPLLKYLSDSSNEKFNANDAFSFGSTFLQKFIQLSFRIPAPTRKDVKVFIKSINSSASQTENESNSEDQTHSVMLEDGEDAEAIQTTVELVASFFDNNPRLLKQYLNAFRLKCHIAFNTGLFLTGGDEEAITIPQVGKFVAMIMLWPKIIDDLTLQPSLIKEVLTDPSSGNSPSSLSESWRLRKGFVEFLKLGLQNRKASEYNMADVSYKRLIETSQAIAISANVRIQSNIGEAKFSKEQNPTGSTTTTTTTSKKRKK